MTKWTDGKRTLSKDDIIGMLFDDGDCAEMFERQFNENFTPIEVVYRYGGTEGYDSEFIDWLSALDDDEVSKILTKVGQRDIKPVRASQTSNSCRLKGKAKSPSSKGKSEKKPAKAGRR